ncbi:MAG: DUF1990 domain-containing protein [Rhodococcus sp. (in: high G+C Gram-positive bacteria)]
MTLTYPEVGGTRGPLPAGYHHTDRRVRIGSGRPAYASAAQALLGWDMHRGAGLRVDASAPTAVVDAEVVLSLGPVRIPCRVVYVVDEVDRTGFAYGTLAGHPEQGEERFVVELDGDGSVYVHIVAFSRPGRWFTKIGGPAGRLVQRVFTSRYCAALARAARP